MENSVGVNGWIKAMLIALYCLHPAAFLFAQLSPTSNPAVFVSGAMRNVMWKGQLSGTILLDTIADKVDLYGLGPIEQLAGEITIINGTCYTSTVNADSSMLVKHNWQVKAPFFVFSRVRQWQEVSLPDTVLTMQQIEAFLHQLNHPLTPVAFKLSGSIDAARIHVVNLPPGSRVSNPEDAHKGTIVYPIYDEQVIVIGCYSTAHKGIFTHHTTNMHLHLLTNSGSKMGHVDSLQFKKGAVKLFLPL